MTTLDSSARFVLDQHLPADFAEQSLRADVLAGLTATPKTLPPKWFYDARGSELFTAITRLPEYYPTRAEAEILAREAAEIATSTGADTVVELGSGSSEKTHLLLDALRDAGTLARYVAIDVSESALVEAAAALLDDYPDLAVHSVVGDFEAHLHLLPADGERRLFVFLGGTIGNFAPAERRAFLAAVRAGMRPGDYLLLGTDLVKSPDVLVPAYDDAAGVTAEFNKNVLRVINRELGADFDTERLRPRRGLGRRARVDRDAPAQPRRPAGACRRPRSGRALRRRGGDAHRDLRQVPPARGGHRARRGRACASAAGGPTARAGSACPSPTLRVKALFPRGIPAAPQATSFPIHDRSSVRVGGRALGSARPGSTSRRPATLRA